MASRYIIESLHRTVIATIYRFVGRSFRSEVEDMDKADQSQSCGRPAGFVTARESVLVCATGRAAGGGRRAAGGGRRAAKNSGAFKRTMSRDRKDRVLLGIANLYASPGDHIGYFYRTPEEQRDALVRYLKVGLDADETSVMQEMLATALAEVEQRSSLLRWAGDMTAVGLV